MDADRFHGRHATNCALKLTLQCTPVIHTLAEFRHPQRRSTKQLKAHRIALWQSLSRHCQAHFVHFVVRNQNRPRTPQLVRSALFVEQLHNPSSVCLTQTAEGHSVGGTVRPGDEDD